MRQEASTPFWAKCPACGHCWPAAYYPLNFTLFAKVIAKPVCPRGCSARAVVAKQNHGILKGGLEQ